MFLSIAALGSRITEISAVGDTHFLRGCVPPYKIVQSSNGKTTTAAISTL